MNEEKMGSASGVVIAVSRSDKHTFSKENCTSIKLLKGLGVEGDAHLGKTVKHRSRVAANPNQPNLRQVHLIHSELLDELKDRFNVGAGQMGKISPRKVSICLNYRRIRYYILGKQQLLK
ncbi:hypothetical protein Q5O89_00505 [Peribacillus frigoritolerans]|nr:hypothetical protein [Peribacillus frigoritolerans]